MTATARLEILRGDVQVPDYALDGNHGCRIWLFDDTKPEGGAWTVRSTIDARELVGGGRASFEKPGDETKPSSAAMTRDDLKRALGRLSKPDLSSLCDQHGVQYGGKDSKRTMIESLATAGVSPEHKAGA